MNKWVKLGGAVLLLFWAPFLYAELTSSPTEKKERLLPDEQEETVPTELHEPEEVAQLGRGGAGEKEEAEEAEENEQAEQPSLDEGEDEPAQPQAQPIAAPVPPTAAAAKEPDPGVEPAADEQLAEEDPQQAEAPPPATDGPVAQLKHAFDSEPRDALWAKDAEARLSGITSGGDMPDSFFEHATCRTAVCRLDVRWSQENAAPYLDAYEELKQAFGDSIAVDPQGTPTEDGLAVHVYVVRKGYTLADLTK